MPGWLKGTVGYHVDDGKIYHAEDPYKGKENKGNVSRRAFFATYLTSESTQEIGSLSRHSYVVQHNKNKGIRPFF